MTSKHSEYTLTLVEDGGIDNACAICELEYAGHCGLGANTHSCTEEHHFRLMHALTGEIVKPGEIVSFYRGKDNE